MDDENACRPNDDDLIFFLFFFFLNPLSSSVAECCSTPYSLLGLVFTVSFIALGVLTLCKFYLQGYRAFMNDNTMHRSEMRLFFFLLMFLKNDLVL